MDFDIQFFYAGENARTEYSYAAPTLIRAAAALHQRTSKFQWDKANNILRVLITTPKDIDPSGEYAKHNWTILPTCGINQDKAAIDILTYNERMGERIHRLLRETAQTGFFGEIDYNDVIINNPGKISALNNNVAQSTLSQNPAAINFSSYVPAMGSSYVIVTMPDTLEQAATVRTQMAGLDDKYLRNIAGSDKDWSFYTLGHEILGHALHGHADDGTASSQYSCTHVDYKLKDISLHHEGFADAAVFAGLAALPAPAVKLGPDFASGLHAVRTFGTFFKNSNAFSAKNSTDIDAHTSNHHFSITGTSYISEFNHSAQDGISSLPLIINTYADAIAGYAFMLERAAEVKKKPRNFTPQEQHFYLRSQQEFTQLERMAGMGYQVRLGMPASDTDSEITANPAYHVAAMTYLKKTGLMDKIKARLAPELRPAFDTLVSDYFITVSRHGSAALTSARVQNHVDASMKKARLDFSGVHSVLFYLPPADAKKAGSAAIKGLENYRTNYGLDQTIPAFVQQRAP
jgi:hypothetical protein